VAEMCISVLSPDRDSMFLLNELLVVR